MDYLVCEKCGAREDVNRLDDYNFCQLCLFWYDYDEKLNDREDIA